MTPEELEFARTFTDKEVMSSAISQLRARTINEYYADCSECCLTTSEYGLCSPLI